MRPPADVPRAPSKSSDDSTTIPLATIAARKAAVLLPGSPDASAASGNGSPSVDAMSYLGIPQPGHSNAAFVPSGDACMTRIRGARGDAFRTGVPRLFEHEAGRRG